MRHGGYAGDGRPVEWRLLRRLWPFVRPYRHAFAAGMGVMALRAGTRVCAPYLLKLAVDGPMVTGDQMALIGYAALYLLLQVAGGGLEVAQVLLIRVRGQDVLAGLRSRLFAKAQRLPSDHLDATPSGQTLSRVTSDVAVLADLFTSGVAALAGDVLLLVGILVAMAQLDLRLALMTYAALPALALVSELFRRWMRRAYRVTREKTARLTGRLQEFLRGFAVLRLFGAEDWAEGEFGTANAEHRDAFLHSVTLTALFFPVVELVAAVVTGFVLWQGGGEVIQSHITLGVLVAFLDYLQKFFRPVRDLSEKYGVLQSSMAAVERIGEFLDLDEHPAGGSRSPEWTRGVELDEVNFAYRDGPPVLNGVSLHLAPGEVVAVVGATGAGKSTLVNLLLGHYRATSGALRIGGVAPVELDPEALRRGVAVVPQEPFLFAGTVLDNIVFGRPWVSEAEARQAAAAVGLGRTLGPGGIEMPVQEEGGSLSAGQRQLVTCARALAGDPRLLLLDEATSEVDQGTELLMETALDTLFRGRTSLVVAHRLATVRRADRVLVLHRGQVAEEGGHEELLARDGIYRKLYELQFRPAAA